MRRLSVAEADEGPAERGDAGDYEDGAREGDDGEEAVGAQKRGCVLVGPAGARGAMK